MIKSNTDIIFAIITATSLFLLLGVFIVAFIILYQKRRYAHFKAMEEIKSKQERMEQDFKQALLQTQIEIQSETLQTVSQEIHDNVGQVLSLVKLNLGTVAETESGANQTKLNNTKQLVSKAIGDLRELSRSLYSNKIAELGLADAIANELKILQNSGQFKTSLLVTGEPFKLDAQKEIVVYRMMQESLNNAIKHSKAQNINVVLKYDAGLFVLTISDDGLGFDTTNLSQTQPGMGLKSMKTRAKLIDGEFSINSFPGKGTTVSITLQNITQ